MPENPLTHPSLYVQERNGILHLSDALVEKLNQCNAIDEVPDYFTKPSLSPKLRFVERTGTGRCVIAVEPIVKGEIVCEANGSKIDKPFKYSWQIEDDVHMIGPGALDHSCTSPNCVVDPDTNRFIAARDINVGEMVTFNYLTTEYDLKQPFNCICGQDDCFGRIKGFKHLNTEDKIRLVNKFPISKYLQKYI